ncbi:DUF4157 domain-containing protein [Sphaerotilus sp.]|uniref:DUF4157 domain-containing protein n=1 Tax=Sphaerotilus sp. TaxID=2093942 RepID=UPI00286E9026|nr:DUF4157 domain-containing protein [Sphaerotilus sp.]
MVLRAPEAKSPVSIRVPAPAVRAAQAAAAVPVSRTSDPAEREAERVSRRIIAMPSAAVAPQSRRFASAVPATTHIPAALGVGSSAGQPLPRRLRRDMEPRFQADFSNVRVHTGDEAARASRRLNAAAFTSGRDVFFGRGRFQPDAPAGRELIAHELTHTIQQGAATQTVHRSVDTSVRERAQPQTVHRLGIQDALDFFADKAAWIPGFSMLALLLGFNPVSLRAVPRTAANLLRAMIQLIPGGPLITQALDNHGIVDKVANWAEGQLSALGDIGSAIRQSIDDFLDSLSWTDIFDLDGVWNRAKRIVTGPIDRIIAFGTGLISGIITFIKDAILRPIAALIEPTRGYPLLKAILGFDPVTGAAVPRTPASLLGGFMTLIGQDEIWQNIQRGNAIGQAYAWFEGALSGLMGIVTAIPGTFLAAFQSLQLVDIIIVPRAFARIIGVFGSIAGQFLSWGLGTVIKLLEIIFSVVAPGAMGYLRRAGGAIQGIFRNPIGFVMNLVNAAKAGFQRFGRNILRHMQTSIVSWLTGSLPGIYIPQALSLPEILKFVLSVLGLSWANIRQKLATAVGEPAVRAMESGFDLVVTLVRDGPAAAWAQMQEQLANLKQMAIDGIIDMVVNLVLTRAVPRLIAMFIPGAGFITAIMSIYGTVTTFIAQLSRIAQVITSFLDSMMAIAAGNIEAAATRVETTLAGLLTLAVNFLAGFAGLGRVADQVRGVIARIRAPIDRALDSVIAWIVNMARRLGQFIADSAGNAVSAVRGWLGLRVGFQDAAGASHSIYFAPSGDNELTVASRPRPVLEFLTAVAAANPTQRPQVEVARGHTRTIARLKRDTSLTDAARTAQIRTASNALAGVLRGLSDSTDFFSPVPAQRKLPGGFDVRNDLYINGSGYGSASAALRASATANISAALISLKSTTSNAAYTRLVRDGQIFVGGDGPSRTAAEYRLMTDAAIRALVGRQSYDVDHTQPLAQHWVATGYNSADGARHSHAGGAGNLKIMLSFYNRQAGADGSHYADKFWVGPAFTSNYNMSLRAAKKIKGQDFPP